MFVGENEIINRLKENLRLAAESCDRLSVERSRGSAYVALRDQLELVENCCRQLGYYRGDARWFNMGLLMAEAYRRAGKWMRDKSMPRTETQNAAHPLFKKLAENLRALLRRAQELETQATGISGLILPKNMSART